MGLLITAQSLVVYNYQVRAGLGGLAGPLNRILAPARETYLFGSISISKQCLLVYRLSTLQETSALTSYRSRSKGGSIVERSHEKGNQRWNDMFVCKI